MPKIGNNLLYYVSSYQNIISKPLNCSLFSVIGENVLVKLSRELSSAMKKCSTSQCYLSLELRRKTEFCFVVIVDEIVIYITFKMRQNDIVSALKVKFELSNGSILAGLAVQVTLHIPPEISSLVFKIYL